VSASQLGSPRPNPVVNPDVLDTFDLLASRWRHAGYLVLSGRQATARTNSIQNSAVLHFSDAGGLVIRAFSFIFLIFLTAFVPVAVRAQGASSIAGVWKVANVETREVATGKVSRPFGDHPTGTFIFTAGGQMIGMQYAANRKVPAGPNPTEGERAALFSSMSAYSGRYHLEGKKLLITIEDSSIQSWNGTTRTLDIEVDGKKLTGTSEPFKSLISGADVIAVVTWERLE
jgi:hypothetical protein